MNYIKFSIQVIVFMLLYIFSSNYFRNKYEKDNKKTAINFVMKKYGLEKESDFDFISTRVNEDKVRLSCKFYNTEIGEKFVYKVYLFIENGKVIKDSIIEYRQLKSYQF
jgi:hypothetical protein